VDGAPLPEIDLCETESIPSSSKVGRGAARSGCRSLRPSSLWKAQLTLERLVGAAARLNKTCQNVVAQNRADIASWRNDPVVLVVETPEGVVASKNAGVPAVTSEALLRDVKRARALDVEALRQAAKTRS